MGYQFKKRAKSLEQVPVVGLLVLTLSNLYYPFLAQNVEIYAKSFGLTIVMQNTMRSKAAEAQSFNYLRQLSKSNRLHLQWNADNL